MTGLTQALQQGASSFYTCQQTGESGDSLLISRTGAALDLDGNVVDVPQEPLVTLATLSLGSSREGNSSFPFLAFDLNLNGLGNKGREMETHSKL